MLPALRGRALAHGRDRHGSPVRSARACAALSGWAGMNTHAIRPRLSVAANVLDRRFAPDAPNRVWTGDITYIATAGLAVSGSRDRSVQP